MDYRINTVIEDVQYKLLKRRYNNLLEKRWILEEQLKEGKSVISALKDITARLKSADKSVYAILLSYKIITKYGKIK